MTIMKKIFALCLMSAIAFSAIAVEPYSIVKTDDCKYRLTFTNSSSVGSSNVNHGYSQGNHKG